MSFKKNRFWAAIGIGSGLTIFFFGVNSTAVDMVRGWVTIICGLFILAIGLKLAPLKEKGKSGTEMGKGEKDEGSIPVIVQREKSRMNWFRKYWWLIIIAIVTIIVTSFAIWVEANRSQEGLFAWRAFNFLTSWSGVLVAAATATLAFATFLLIWQTGRIRSVEKESALRRRRLDEVLGWINEALRLKAAFSVPLEGFEHMPLVSQEWITQREVDKKLLVAKKVYVAKEAERIDSELAKESTIKPVIERLAWIFEHETDLSNERIQPEIEKKCIAVVAAISELRAKLRL